VTADDRFCGGCGTALSDTCRQCGRPLLADQSFCTGCGAARDQPEPETNPTTTEDRRAVSVLFVDVVDFTRYAEQSDPELVRQLQNRFYATVRRVVGQHGGVVEKYIGDAAMALFGAPVATETDALRCVRVGLELQRVLASQYPGGGRELRFRVGVATGEALVDVAAARNGGQAIVAGDVVNSASRLQSVAPPGGVLVDGRTYALTANAIRYQEHPPIVLRGRSAPTEVWLALAPMQRQHDVAPDATPLVEREHELGLLAGALRRVVRDRTPQLVTIFGQAGIGKSRLVRELRRRADQLVASERANVASDAGGATVSERVSVSDDASESAVSERASLSHDPAGGAERVVWLTGDCPPFGENVTYAGLADVVKAAAGVLDTDPPATAHERLQAAVRRVVQGPDADRLVEAVAPLVGLPGPVLPAEEAESAWRRLLVAIAARNPTVLVFEDLHWADESMLRFIELLAAAARDVPLLILGTARPELITRDSSWAGTITGSLTITLPPLREAAMTALYQHILGQAAFATELLRPLMELANGNPLYAQEYVRMLVERGAVPLGTLGHSASDGGLPMPDSVHAVIANRVDLLEPADRSVLQAAAVVGMQFWPGAVAAALGRQAGSVERALRRLEQREFIAEQPESSMAGQGEFRFQHVLVRDVCYQRLPRTERIARHERTADWLDATASQRHTDLAEVLANHRWAAHEIARTLGLPAARYAPPARRALHLAARRAYALHALDTAASYTARALSLFDDDPGTEPERLRLELLATEIAFYRDRAEFLAGSGADQLRALAERLTTVARTVGAESPAGDAARAWTLLGQAAWLRADRVGAFDYLARAVALFAPLPDSAEKIDAYAELGRLHMSGFELESAIASAGTAAAIADRLGLVEAHAGAQITIAIARYESGDQAGYVELREVTERCRANRLLALRRAIRNLGYVVLQEGDWRRSEELYAEARQLDGPGGHNVLTGYAGEAIRDAYYTGDFAVLAAGANGSMETLWEDDRDLRACLRALRDDPGAIADADAAVADAQGSFQRNLWPPLAAAALCRALLGERAEAAELLAELTGAWRKMAVFASASWVSKAAHAAALAGPEAAEALRAPLAELRYRTPWAEAALRTVTGATARAAGDPAEAGRCFLAAADLYATIPVMTDRALALALATAAFTAAGRPDQAGPALAEVTAFAERNAAPGLLRVANG
jgi:class 3 adenylate cyclase